MAIITSVIFKCDKCGKEIPDKEGNEKVYDVSTSEIELGTGGDFVGVISGRHLCSRCFDEFNEWLSGLPWKAPEVTEVTEVTEATEPVPTVDELLKDLPADEQDKVKRAMVKADNNFDHKRHGVKIPFDLGKAAEMCKAGFAYADIALELGVGKSTVIRRLNEAGIFARRGPHGKIRSDR